MIVDDEYLIRGDRNHFFSMLGLNIVMWCIVAVCFVHTGVSFASGLGLGQTIGTAGILMRAWGEYKWRKESVKLLRMIENCEKARGSE